ncbi:MAG: SGNH/GDSL hydrolase family protein [Armatimonadota bacterium]
MKRTWKLMMTTSVCLLAVICGANAQELTVNQEAKPMKPVPVVASASNLRPILPSEIYALPGIETNIYFDNVILSPSSRGLLWDIDCDFGTHQEERWTAIPTAEQVGDHLLKVRVVTPEVQTVVEMTTTLRVIDPKAGGGREVTMLCIGASGTAASVYTGRLAALSAQDEVLDLKLIGEGGPGGDTGNRHEGYGGWSCRSFVENWADGQDFIEENGMRRRGRSPFLFEVDGRRQLNFQRYLDRNNAGKPPDFITILLGGNDNFTATEADIEQRIDTMFSYLDQLIAAIRAAAPKAQIGIVPMTPPAASQDAFGANYGTSQTRWQYRRNQHRTTEREYQTYGGREAEGLFLVPVFVGLDTVHGYPTKTAPANAHAETQIARMCNGLHPAPAGYTQMGDVFYCWLKSRLAAK